MEKQCYREGKSILRKKKETLVSSSHKTGEKWTVMCERGEGKEDMRGGG